MKYGIVGTGAYLPTKSVTNADLTPRLGVGPEWVVERTGIVERRVAAPQEATSDCATGAARQALANAGICASELDYIIVGTSTPDFPQPATACLVQQTLGAERAAAFDVNAVCTSFVYALDVARGLLTADPRARHALVIGADVYSRQLNYTDRRTCVLFGDGAGAVVLSAVDDGYGLVSSRLVSDGRLHDLVKVRGGGSRAPLTAAALAAGENLFTMQGRLVRRYVENVFPQVLGDLLKDADLEADDIDLLVPHQANGVLLAQCAEAVGIPAGKVHGTFQRYGNTGAASVPITLHDAATSRHLPAGAVVVLLGFGGGMTAGGSLHRWVPGVNQGGFGVAADV